MSLVHIRTTHGLFKQSPTYAVGNIASPTSLLCSTFVNYCVLFWPSLLTYLDTSVSDCRTGSNKSG